MRKFFVILAFLSFTFNVNAEGTGGYTSNITIAEGEEISFESVLAAQNTLRNDGWFENCVSGSEIRVYTDYLPNDDSITLNTKVLDVKDANSTPWTYKTVADPETHSSLEWFYLCQQSDTATASSSQDQYEKYIQYDTSQDLTTGYEYVSQEELSRVNALQYANTYTANDSAGVQGARARAYNRALINNAVMLPNAGVMLNNLHITITNAQGQTTAQFDTNIVVKLDQILQKVTRIQTDTSTMVQELSFLINALGFDGLPGSSTSNLAEFLGQWRTADGVWQGEVLDVITNSVDYTDFLKYYIASGDSFTNFTPLVYFNNLIMKGFTNNTGSGLSRNNYNFLLGSSVNAAITETLEAMYNNTLVQNHSLSSLMLFEQIKEFLYEQGHDYVEAQRLTNIVNAVSLGRDWLNLATNDISSLPYWLNQQDYALIGGTNTLTRFDVITNQYAHIGLTGSGQQSNSADTWNYFKRLEMLLAALVYKQTDYEGKIDPHESGNNASVSSSVATGEDQINTSLTAVKDALTLSTIGNAKNNIVSLFQTATSAFDVNGSKRVINVMETDVATGNESTGVTVNVDFTQGELGDFADFVHHLFGFAWGFGSLFIFWRVCKFCWDMGYKVVKFHYSLCRKFLGI